MKVNDWKGKVKVGKHTLGKRPFIVAGPCSVETKSQSLSIARSVKKSGASAFRGGAFKPRSSPYSFQGLGRKGLDILLDVKKDTGLPIVTEVMDTRDVPLVSEYADVMQIGARNSQNFNLLKEVGKTNTPVLLKRGLSMTIDEWLNSAEYVLSEGNNDVIFCERGIRSFDTHTRNVFDVSAIPVLKSLTKLPIIADPSHAAGRPDIIIPLSRAAIAVGADGLIVEVHNNPKKALSDKDQAILPKQFSLLVKEIKKIR